MILFTNHKDGSSVLVVTSRGHSELILVFESLAAYEQYRTRLKSDTEALENFTMANSHRLILREERNFVEVVADRDLPIGNSSTLFGLKRESLRHEDQWEFNGSDKRRSGSMYHLVKDRPLQWP